MNTKLFRANSGKMFASLPDLLHSVNRLLKIPNGMLVQNVQCSMESKNQKYQNIPQFPPPDHQHLPVLTLYPPLKNKTFTFLRKILYYKDPNTSHLQLIVLLYTIRLKKPAFIILKTSY